MTSPRVEAFLSQYTELSDAQQQMVRDMVDLAWLRVRRQLLADRLAASAPYKISAGARR